MTAESTAIAAPALEMRGITKHYPGVLANDHIDLDVRPGEIHALLGENGAGKTTLMKILVGLQRPDGGQVVLRGQPISLDGPESAIRNGIGMVFQEGCMIPNLSVADNLFLGHEDSFETAGLLSGRRMNARAREVLAQVGLPDLDPRTQMRDLPAARKQMVEIARLLWLSERYGVDNPVLILDEPTTVLQDAEAQILFQILRDLKQRASIIFISHRLEEVVKCSDRVYILKDGECVAEMAHGEAEVGKIIRLMVGRDANAERYRESMQGEPGAEVTLRVKQLRKGGCFEGFSLELRAGEIVSLVGLLGSGKEDVCRCLVGADQPDGGAIEVGGRPVRFGSPKDAIAAGVGCVPIDRRNDGLATTLGVGDNVNLLVLQDMLSWGLLRPARERENAARWVSECLIKTPSLQTLCANLSGGNQQKVVIAKWLAADVRVLVLDHPTRGIDVGAKEEIYARIRTLAAAGMSLLIMCDTLEEDIGLSHRMVVMKDGKVMGELACAARQKPSPVDVIGYVV
jgi:ribose transport system ATP-binding protein